MKEELSKLDNFLSKTLNGYSYIQFIDIGIENIDRILANPKEYQLGHVSGDINAWIKSDRLVYEFNDGLHYVFTPIGVTINHSLKFREGQWQ